jgi:ADP-heptose:LPS heptosyltransferase
MNNILVIKHGALGDFILGLGPMEAILRHHPGAQITLLTTAPFAEMAKKSGYFDAVWLDDRPKMIQIADWVRLLLRLKRGNFDYVYDLQTSGRTVWYFRLMGRPGWCGHVKGCSHRHANPDRDRMHTVDRQKEQLAAAGIKDVPWPDLSWMETDVSGFGLPERYVLLIPGGSAHRPEKRWPADRFGDLANVMLEKGLRPVLIGTAAEHDVLKTITDACPEAVSLEGKTSLFDLYSLAENAAGVIGNDTGPMHVAVASGASGMVLFSAASDPALCAPRARREGQKLEILQVSDLKDLKIADILAKLPF